MIAMKRNMLDDYVSSDNTVINLSWIGTNDSNLEDDELICEFCNIPVIDKLDDKHLGYEYCRKI